MHAANNLNTKTPHVRTIPRAAQGQYIQKGACAGGPHCIKKSTVDLRRDRECILSRLCLVST